MRESIVFVTIVLAILLAAFLQWQSIAAGNNNKTTTECGKIISTNYGEVDSGGLVFAPYGVGVVIPTGGSGFYSVITEHCPIVRINANNNTLNLRPGEELTYKQAYRDHICQGEECVEVIKAR